MDYNRMIQVLRWNIIAYKSELLRFFFRALTAFGFVTFATHIGSWISRSANISNTYQAAHICIIAFAILFAFSASQVCFNMKTKTECISYTMLPATKLEKFLVNIFYQTFVVIVITFAGLIVVDLVQSLIGLIACHEAHSMTLAVLESFGDSINFTTGNYGTGIATALLVHSVYVLGGTFFRKHQFLYTTLAYFTIVTVLGIIAVAILGSLAYGSYKAGYDITFEWLINDTWKKIVGTLFTFALSGLFYFLSYRSFCRIQVINNRFFN